MNLIPGIRATGNALAAEKVRLSVVAQNIANAHTTRDADGGVYKRKLVAFEALIDEAKEPVAFNHTKKNLGMMPGTTVFAWTRSLMTARLDVRFITPTTRMLIRMAWLKCLT